MAKKNSAKSKGAKKRTRGPAETVRSAVERTFQATAEGAAGTRERAQDLVEELSALAARLREAAGLDERIEALRGEVQTLAQRVANLEAPGRSGRSASPRTRSTAKKASAGTRSTAKKATGASRSTAKKTTGAGRSSAKKASSGTRRTSSARKASSGRS